MPNWSKVVPQLVLIDGQGIGHTVSSTTSLPTQTSRKFETVDTVLLVDSAKQPMQAASLTVLRSLAASGHLSKIRICFTHLDELRGDNLPSRKSRVAHVAASLHQAVNHIRETLGPEVATNLDVVLNERSYYLSNLDQPIQDKDKYTLSQLQKLLDALETSIFEDVASEAKPVYEEANLVIAIQNATRQFHESWRARLGFPSTANDPAQHWTRIKALARRLAHVFDHGEYAGLRPVAELTDRLMQHIRVYLNQPVRWIPGSATEEEKKTAVDRIAREIHSQFLDLVSTRLWMDRLAAWNSAYELSGIGSGHERARSFRRLFEEAAPIPGEGAMANTQDFLLGIKTIVKAAINDKGGKV